MTFYTNHTRHSSVLTLKVNAAQDLKVALKIGVAGSPNARAVELGLNDIAVQAGERVALSEGVDAVFVGVRAGE